jgi:hypothetical protein
MEPFTRASLQKVYDRIAADGGVSIAELRALLHDFSSRPIADADVQAYREGRKPWKKLHDEVVPVEHFVSARHPDSARVRFPLNDQSPDAWLMVDGEPVVGIEVTAALGRSSVEIARGLAGRTMAPGFIGLQDDAKQSEFDSVRSKGRITNSRAAVDTSIDRAITSRLEGKDKQKFAGQTLLITAPIGSSPNRGIEDLRTKLGSKASRLPFAQVFVMDDRTGKQIVQLK